jgi:NADPH2:quinone reductase
MATLAYGGLAEQAVAKEAETFAVPEGMPFEEAGAFPISYISSDVALRWQGRLEPGETLLVLGAAGGVGLTAVEIGKAMGARVIAGASTAEKLAVARDHGADDLIDYTAEKLTDRVMALTGDKGADVCFDPIGGELSDAALSSLGWGGRLLLVGFVGGVQQIPGQPAPGEEPLGARLLAPVLPLACAGQAPALGRGAAAVVSERASSSRASPTDCRSSAAPRPSGS